ncbi:MAG: S4 domain-containing protein [Pacificimonas sp.]|jgi:ribosome-associated heat shock protein Hsp15|nr:S4 domain-containing protein [Pacificimonas sp.]
MSRRLVPQAPASQRLDKYLWFTRLTRSRKEAQELAQSRRLRIDGRVIEKPSAPVHVGDVLAFTRHDRVQIVRVEALPSRRGPAAEARTHYSDLSQADPAQD